jgi:Flp pilus assembly protein TadD
MFVSPMTRLSLAFFAIGIFLLAGSVRADDLAEANKLLRAGQHEQAMEHVNRMLAGKPADPQARFLKGLIHAEQGDAGAAIRMFQKLTEDYPELPEPYNNLAVIYASQGQYDKARLALEQSIRTHPSYATAYENLGDVYARLASQAYDKALKLDSTNAGAQNKLALVRDLVGRSPREAPVVLSDAPKSAPVAPVAPGPKPQAKPPVTPLALPGAQPPDVLEAVAAWADAWSRKDVDAYLAAYAKGFRTPKGQSRSDWEKQRRTRLTAPKSIVVELDFARVVDKGDGRISVTFRQDYRSDLFSGTAMKTLLMDKSDGGRWRILEEQVSN